MNNYVYIIAGFPNMINLFDHDAFSYYDIKDEIEAQLSEKDRQVVDFLDEGFYETSLNEDFYKRAAVHKNAFIRRYFDFDLRLRNMKVQYLAKRLNQKAEQYMIEAPEAEFEEAKQVQNILTNEDFVLREQLMDQLKWDKAAEIVNLEIFSFNMILSFLVKAKIVDRWTALDEKTGKIMFQKLVEEVRSTFDGIKNDNK